MKHCNALENQTTSRMLLITCAAALAVVFTVSLSQPAHAGKVTPPPVPNNIQVPEGNKAFLVGHAFGTQNYICLSSGWTLFTPQATLFYDNGRQAITHFFSPNPFEDNTNPAVVVADGMIRATWQHSRDTSTVWGLVETGHSSTDTNFVASGAIAWLLVTIVGVEDSPTGHGKLSDTTYVQRLNTSGGVSPSTSCSVGEQAFIPYTADYFFFRHDDGN